jgi:xanthine dehydrogenase YagS FAD-binding subunit
MMKAFAYQSPATVSEALSALGKEWGETDILAGGTDLLALLKDGLAGPNVVVNVKDIKELAGVEIGNGLITIGATTTLADIGSHSALKKHLPALANAAAAIGGPQIRNMGTLGGNLCQRPRDWYFRSGLEAKEREENQYGAIFPVDGMDYVSPSTLAPPLIAYGASVEVQGPDGKRTVPVEKFFQVSKLKPGERETVLKPNEIVLGVTVPVAGVQSADYEVRERDSHDWPLVQASVALTLQGDKVSKANIILGHVSPLPKRAKTAEQALVGKTLTQEVAHEAGQAAAEGANAKGKAAYKKMLVQVAVKRALLAAIEQPYWR